MVHETPAPAPARRAGRPKRGEQRLTRQGILAAALTLVDEHGLAALSMRRLAAELGVDPMSIYHHLPNKAALVSGLVNIVFAEMPLARVTEAGPWDERVRAWVRAYRDLAEAHPHLVLQIVSDSAAATEAAILISEPLYAALDAAGLPPARIAAAAGTLVDFVNGYALATAGRTRAGRSLVDEEERDRMAERLAAQEPGQAPTMRRVHETGGRPHAGFEAGIEIILSGIRVVGEGPSVPPRRGPDRPVPA